MRCLLVAGMYGLAWLAFAGPNPQTFELAGYQVELPARFSTGRSEQGERAVAAWRLFGILVGLCMAAVMLVRLASPWQDDVPGSLEAAAIAGVS
jgi:hypothetical protein